jgi:hypothetical protein
LCKVLGGLIMVLLEGMEMPALALGLALASLFG